MLKFTDVIYASIIIFVFFGVKWGVRFLIMREIGKQIEQKTKEVKELFKREGEK